MAAPTVLKVVKMGGVIAVVAIVCLVIGLVQTGGNVVNGWTVAGIWCMAVYAVSLIAALIVDWRRRQSTR